MSVGQTLTFGVQIHSSVYRMQALITERFGFLCHGHKITGKLKESTNYLIIPNPFKIEETCSASSLSSSLLWYKF